MPELLAALDMSCMQAGQKRSKSEELAAGASTSAPDGAAKQALENEFECTVCRVRL